MKSTAEALEEKAIIPMVKPQDAALLYEPPFTGFTPSGPEELLGSAQVDGLLAVLSQIREAALAA